MDEGGVEQAFGQHDVGHGAHHGGVGTGADGDPLVGQGCGGERVARVDADHAGAITPGEFDEVVGVGAVAHFGGVPAPHQDVAAVEPVLALVAGDERAPDGGRGRIDGGPRVGVGYAETAAVQVHQAAGGVRAVELVVGAGAVGDKQRSVAVVGFDALELGGDGIQGFIP